MEKVLTPSVGTELKLNITAELGNGLHLADVNFTAIFYSSPRRSEMFTKEDMVKVDDDNYIAVIDTAKLGDGEYMMKLTAEIPDADCDDGFRTEVVKVSTHIFVKG